MAYSRTSDKRATIGFVTANIHIGAGRTLWPGVVDAAEKHRVNLICFPGGELRDPAGFEAQRNVIYDLMDAERLGGLVTWASTLGGTLGPAEIVEFHQHYRSLPMVSLAHFTEEIPTLSVDSYQGMRAAIIHLIERHGYRRLAFIRGPASHVYAQERYRAYTDVLREYGLPYLPKLVTRPVPWEAGAEAVQMLLDEAGLRPGVDFEAVVAVSDLLALDAMKALQSRSIQVPGDVAVVGFNDSAEGRLATPPLTSVSLPFYEQGTRAVETLCARMIGEKIPAQVMLQTRLVVRQSCGCPSEAVAQAAAGSVTPRGDRFADAIAAIKQVFLSEVTRDAAADGDELEKRAGQLLDAFQADLIDRPRGLFQRVLVDVLDRVMTADGEVADWQDVISTLRRCTLPYLTDRESLLAEDLFGQARIVIGEAAQRTQAYRQLQAERQAQTLREIGQALITTFDVEKLADALAEKLPELDIASCYLALYVDPSLSLGQSRLVLAYTDQGRATLEPGGRRFLSSQLVPEDLLPRHRRFSFVVEPLFFREEHIGFVLFEIGPRDGTVYEVLRAHISSALKGALLFHEAQQSRLAAEKADQIKTRLLANVSHELRTPLNIILDTTRTALRAVETLPQTLQNDLQHIQNSAEHQLRVINDLLDLSRAEIDELDLYLELLDTRPLLEEAFHSIADRAATPPDVSWQLRLPERLPWIHADAVRLRQILLNILSNAGKFTERGHITLGAEITPPYLHIWVEDTGIGIAPDQQERIFEPFATAEHGDDRPAGGIGLGLSITRHLVMLHGGTLKLDSQPGQGSIFHIYLPLPRLDDRTLHAPGQVQPVLLLISTAEQPAAEIIECSRRQALEIRRLHAGDDLDAVLADVQPAALAWDLVGANPGDWAVVRRLRNHPRLSQSPFILYGQVPQGKEGENALTVGLTSFVVKSAGGQALLDAINASCPPQATGPVLIVDDDPKARALHRELAAKGLPGYPIRTAVDGETALLQMAEEVPSLVILDLMMPGMDGFDVLERMRADSRLRHVPVVILSGKLLSLDDVKRLEQHAHVTLQSKGILSEAETIAALNRALFGTDALPPHTSALVKRAVAYLHQNYARPLSRWEMAEAIGASKDYLGRVFSRELGLTPWDYLNRYRVNRAKELLCHTDSNIGTIAHQVGYRDQAYFSRVFRKLTGKSPNAFRENPET